MQKAAQAYLQTQIATTSQGALLLMLYDGAVKFLKQAKEKIIERNYEQKGILISKALDVISELDACLNVDRGGDISGNLHRLYFYCNTRLLTANLKMDVACVDEVVKILEGLREAYANILGPGDNATATSRLGSQAGTGAAAKTAPSVSGVSSAGALGQQDARTYAPVKSLVGVNNMTGDKSTSLQSADASAYAPAYSQALGAQAAVGREMATQAEAQAHGVAPNPEADKLPQEVQETETMPQAAKVGGQGFARGNALYKRVSGQL